MTNPDLVLFVDGLSYKNEKGNFQADYAVNYYELLERGNLPQAKSTQQTELHVLARAHQLSEEQIVNIYTHSQYAFGVIHGLGILRKQQGFPTSTRTLIKYGQVSNLLIAILLPSKIAVIKTEAHTKKTEPVHQGNALGHFHAQAVARVWKGPGTCG